MHVHIWGSLDKSFHILFVWRNPPLIENFIIQGQNKSYSDRDAAAAGAAAAAASAAASAACILPCTYTGARSTPL